MRLIVILAGAALAASAFLNWVRMPFGGGFTPWDSIGPILGPDAPLEVLIYAGTFALGGLASLIALLARPSRLITLLAGIGPFASSIYGQVQFIDSPADLQWFGWDFSEGIVPTLNRITESVGIGFYAYWGGAALLVIVGLSDGGRGRPRRDRDHDVI